MPNNLGFVEKVNWLMKKYKLLLFLIKNNSTYTEAILNVTQSGSGNPVINSTVSNNTGLTFTVTKNGTGSFYFTPAGGTVDVSKVIMSVMQPNVGTYIYGFTVPDPSLLTVYTYSNGTQTDGITSNLNFIIRFYK